MENYSIDIVINIIASIIVGVAVWFWSKYRNEYSLRKKRNFYNIKRDQKIYLTINQYNQTKLMSHRDISTLIDISKIPHDLDGDVMILPIDEVKFSPGEYVEFCIGGVDSNRRSELYLDEFFKNIYMNSYQSQNSLRIEVGNDKFDYEKDRVVYSILAKFYPNKNTELPVFLICGQTSLSNKGAAYYLMNNYQELYKKHKNNPFCYILMTKNFKSFGHKNVSLVKDVSEIVY